MELSRGHGQRIREGTNGEVLFLSLCLLKDLAVKRRDAWNLVSNGSGKLLNANVAKSRWKVCEHTLYYSLNVSVFFKYDK